MSASGDNLKEQDPIAIPQLMMIPAIAGYNLLVERQRRSRLELVKLLQQSVQG